MKTQTQELISYKNASGEMIEVSEERVKISVSGDSLTEHCTIVDDVIKERFAAEYRQFKESCHALVGPLEGWNNLHPRLVRDLKELHCETIEYLASITDVKVTRIVNGRALREQALEYPSQIEVGSTASTAIFSGCKNLKFCA